jgi:hypothetical protein
LGIRRDVAAIVKRSLAGARDEVLKLETWNISGDLQPFEMDPGSSPGVTAEEGGMDPGSVIPVPDRVRDDGSETGMTNC